MRTYLQNSPSLPKVKSPISQAVVVDRHCYISGQLSTDLEGNYIEGTPIEEARRAFENVFLIAQAAGFSRTDFVFVDIAFINLNDVAAINTLYAELFEENKRPARTIYQAAALPYGGKVKVTVVAIKS